MQIELPLCTIRNLQASDAQSIAEHLNNHKVTSCLRDRVPYPYSLADAENFISSINSQEKPTAFALEVEGQAVGSIGVIPGTDVERISGEVGYWLSEQYWDRGILSQALPEFVQYVLTEFALIRLYAFVSTNNPASARVLEKAGFAREATLRRSAIKEGEVIDRWLYSYVVEEPLGPIE